MNAVLASLVNERLVQRRPHPDHGRIIILRLTERGARVFTEADRLAAKVEGRMVAGTSPEERKRLVALLRTFTDSLVSGTV
jgi:DNA-binding MarR family transcriptional regulator